jgi:hypothetical protein
MPTLVSRQDVEAPYFLYWNAHRRRARIHTGLCSWAKGGRGVTGERVAGDSTRDGWEPPLETKADAWSAAQRLGYTDIAECGRCIGSDSAMTTYRVFM